MAVDLQVFLLERHIHARRDPDLLAHEVHAKDGLGHRVFDLQARVHLDEKEFSLFIEKFDGACADIVDLGHRIGANLANPCPFLGADGGAGGFFQYLLVAALQRTVALAQMHRAALAVTKHLHFDMARGGQVLFDIDFVIAERGLGFRARGHEGALHLACVPGDFHAAPATTGGGLDDDGVSHLFTKLPGLIQCRHTAIRSGNAGHAQRLHRVLGRDLVAHHADMFRRRADKGQVVILDDLHELGVFRQKAIAGVDRLGPGDLAGRDDGRKGQVGLR